MRLDAPRPGLVNRPLLLLFVATFGALTSFCLLLSVVPLYASSVGTDRAGVGLATGALLLATVGAELATPRLMAAYGHRLVLGVGLLLLGAPALALPASTDLASIVAVSAVRGVGFGIVVVVSSVLVAVLVPPARRGEGLGLYGVVVGIPTVVALPAGVWLAGQVGYGPVFVAGGVASLAVLAAVPALPGRRPPPGHSERPDQTPAARPAGVLAGLRTRGLVLPSIAFSATAMASGVVVTFIPLAVPGSGSLAALALLAQGLTATLTRWWAGRHGDRHGPAGLLVPGVLVAAAGVVTLVLIGSPVAVVGGMLLFGAGFGISQNASLALMFDRVPASGYGAVSGVWNVAYDAGMGLGAAGFGVLAAQTGYPGAFALTAALMLVALVPAWRDLGTRPPGRYADPAGT